jgi:2'-5' RNA ligase
MLQLNLPGMDAPLPLVRHRLFIAVLPPNPIASRITQLALDLRSDHELYGRPFEVDRLHISMHMLGNYATFPKELIDDVNTIMHRTRLRSCIASFDRVSSLAGKSRVPRRCAIALRDSSGARGLKELRRVMADVLPSTPRISSFTPHITLLYDRQNVAEEAISEMKWTVTEAALIHSKINRGSLQPYSLLTRWPLE